MTITLPTGLINLHQEVTNAVINQLGRDCKLIYPKKQISCPNCYTDTISKRSSGRYKVGGPLSFTLGQICPWCQGEGFTYTDVTDTVKLRVYWQQKDFMNKNMYVDKAGSVIEVRGNIELIPKMIRAEFLEVHDVIRHFMISRFQRKGECIPYGFGVDSFFVGYWKKVD